MRDVLTCPTTAAMIQMHSILLVFLELSTPTTAVSGVSTNTPRGRGTLCTRRLAMLYRPLRASRW
eukprot:3481386-Pleurochrysis_carterae.AAC.1